MSHDAPALSDFPFSPPKSLASKGNIFRIFACESVGPVPTLNPPLLRNAPPSPEVQNHVPL